MKLIFTILILPLLSFGQTGFISGNAFWKYNDYVGNKPDAGADVFVFSKDSTSYVYNIQCDVQGNFRLDNVPVGYYLIVIRSENTTTRGDYNITRLESPGVPEYLGFDINTIDKPLYDSLPIYNDLYLQSMNKKPGMFGINKYLKSIDTQKEIYYQAVNRLMREIPKNEKTIWFHFNLITQPKLYIREINVTQNQTSVVVADFGISYS